MKTSRLVERVKFDYVDAQRCCLGEEDNLWKRYYQGKAAAYQVVLTWAGLSNNDIFALYEKATEEEAAK